MNGDLSNDLGAFSKRYGVDISKRDNNNYQVHSDPLYPIAPTVSSLAAPIMIASMGGNSIGTIVSAARLPCSTFRGHHLAWACLL